MSDFRISRRELALLATSWVAGGGAGGNSRQKAKKQMAGTVSQSGTTGTEQVAPGVWRLRLGTPEAQTPLHFRAAPPDLTGFSHLAPSDHPPFPPEEIVFRATGRGCAVDLPMSADERIYGLGLNTRLFDRTDRRSFLRPSDNPEDEQGDSHAPVPFYVSTRGYGVYVDTARYASFYTGNVAPVTKAGASGAAGGPADNTQDLYRARMLAAKTMLVDVPSAHGVDIYLFGGPTMADAVCRYNLFSGGGCVPPLWGLGIAYRGKGDFSAADSRHLAQTLRDQHMPCDIWGVEPGWQTKTYSSSFVWDRDRFPDPVGFIREMHALGFHTSFWQHAFTHPTSPMSASLRPFSGDFRVWDGLVPDFATAGGRRVFVGHQEAVLFAHGADSVKLDECDNQPDSATPWSFPEASAFPSGLDGEQYHSLFGKLYQQALWEPLRERNRRTWGLARNSHALASPLPYVLYSDSYDHRCYVRGLANAGFSGLLWSPEVRDSASVEELCRRVGTAIFSPYAMINAWYLTQPPWVQINRDRNNRGEPMPEQAEATQAVRRLFDLRMRLIPYLYSAFNDYRRTGMPPTRALVLDWPDDAEARQVDDQFLCGPSLLVAPLFTGEAQRSVYLPPGEWFDFWTSKRHAGGGRINVTSPLDQVPVFVRGETLLPLAAPVEHVLPETRFDLTVRVYGDRPMPFRLYADDGLSDEYLTGRQTVVTLSWEAGTGTTAAAGGYTGPERYRISEWTTAPSLAQRPIPPQEELP